MSGVRSGWGDTSSRDTIGRHLIGRHLIYEMSQTQFTIADKIIIRKKLNTKLVIVYF